MEKSLLTKLGESQPVIQLTYRHSVDELSRFMRFNIAERNLKFILPTCLIMVIVGIVGTVISKVVYGGIALVLCSLLLPLCMLSISFFMVKKKLYDDRLYVSGVSTYKFYDEFIHTKMINDRKVVQNVISYMNIFAVYETATNVYIYINKLTAIIIQKLKMTEQEIRALRDFLRSKIGRKNYRNQLGFVFKDERQGAK